MKAHVIAACLLVFLSAVAITDLRTNRIPNWLTLLAVSAALVLNLSVLGKHGVVATGTGLVAGLLAFLPFYLGGGFGAGDVKAMAAVGSFVGAKGALLAATWTLLVGGVGALIVVAALRWRAARSEGRWSIRDAGRHRFPYGLAIACGTAISLVWN